MFCVGKIGIEKRSPDLQPLETDLAQFLGFGQSGSPDCPQPILPGHGCAIGLQTLLPCLLNASAPLGPRLNVGEGVNANRGLPQNIQIVYFAQNVLYALQVLAPAFAKGGEKILHDVTKSLQSDAQCMECDIGPIAQST